MSTISDMVAALATSNDVTVSILVLQDPDGNPIMAKGKADGSLSISQVVTGGESSIAPGETSKEISHGLGAIPTVINVTAETGVVAPLEVVRASTTSTVFVVQNLGGIVQPAGTTAYFYWECKK